MTRGGAFPGMLLFAPAASAASASPVAVSTAKAYERVQLLALFHPLLLSRDKALGSRAPQRRRGS